ncbi:MAG: hypothetical protein ACXV6K_08895, partial [Halobacteriota archaeon]
MVETDIILVKSAIESMKASNWGNRSEIIRQLEEDLDALYEELIKSYSSGYEDAQTLIKISDWSESEKERVLKLLREVNDVEQAEEREGQKVRAKMTAKDPSFFAVYKVVRSTGRALNSGAISEEDAYKLVSYALETGG